MRRTSCQPLLAALTIILCGCGEFSTRSASRSLGLSLATRITSDDAGEAYQFTAIRSVVEHGAHVLVLDAGDDRVRVFDTTGVFVRAIGGRGGGPGEFLGGAWTMGVVHDTIWVIDHALRIQYFSVDGQTLGQTLFERMRHARPSSGTPYFTPIPQLVAPGDTVLGFGGYSAAEARRGEIVSKPLLAFSREGRTRDTIGWAGTERTDLLTSYSAPALVQPFADDPLVVYRPSSALTFVVHRAASTDGNSAAIRLVALSVSGDTVRDRAYTYQPRLLSDAIADSGRRWVARRWARVPASEQQKRLYIPAYEVPITDAVAGTECLWLRREVTHDSTVYSVVGDAPSAPLRRAVLPAKSRVLWASRSHLWSERLDDDDVPTLERWTIHESC